MWETGKEDLLEKYVKGDERSTLIHWGPITLVVGQSGWCHLPARSRLRPFLVWTCSSGLAEAPAVRREIRLPPLSRDGVDCSFGGRFCCRYVPKFYRDKFPDTDYYKGLRSAAAIQAVASPS